MVPIVEAALEALKNRGVSHIDNYVFVNRNGRPIDKHYYVHWQRALRKAGLRYRDSYQCRHTFASLCLSEGMPATYVAATLGHTTIEMVVRRYGRWINNESDRQHQKLRSLFSVVTHQPAANRKVEGSKITVFRQNEESPQDEDLADLSLVIRADEGILLWLTVPKCTILQTPVVKPVSTWFYTA